MTRLTTLSNSSLIDAYNGAKKLKLKPDFINILENEIKSRKLILVHSQKEKRMS